MYILPILLNFIINLSFYHSKLIYLNHLFLPLTTILLKYNTGKLLFPIY